MRRLALIGLVHAKVGRLEYTLPRHCSCQLGSEKSAGTPARTVQDCLAVIA
jgi:hypothetical protein